MNPQLDIFTMYPKSPPTVTSSGTTTHKPTQAETLYRYLRLGGKIADHESYQVLGFPNLRSRVCNVEKQFNVVVKREKRTGKKYNEYYL